MRRVVVVFTFLVLLVGSVSSLVAGRMYDPELSRFATPDPALNTPKPNDLLKINQGALLQMSPYAYAANNPLKYVDPDGRWFGPAHDKILQEAFRGVLTDRQIKILQAASRRVDKDQSPEGSFKHAMRDGTKHQSVTEARELMNSFIEEKVETFVEEKDEDKALDALGEALHPIMDSTSPSHEGFQPWNGIGTNPTNSVGRGGKALKHLAEESNPSPEKIKETAEKVRQLYDAMVKRKKKSEENQENEKR